MPRLIVKPFAHHDHPREIIRQFTPNWFTVTMGTGVVALALGPLGTGALGLLVLGHDAPALLGAAGMGSIGQVAQGVGIIGGLVLWGYGAWWLIMAAAITLTYLREGLPFNMGWWGFTFPLGVYTLSTLNLGAQTGIAAFTVLGGVFVVALVGFWVLVTARTLAGGYRGHLFSAPCLASGRMQPIDPELITWPS